MMAEAKKGDLLLSTYHNRHWDGCILEAVERLKEKKEIGDIFRIEIHMGGYSQPRDWWRSSQSISGGIHYDWGVHLLEYSLQIIESELAEVSAFAKRGFWESKWGDDANDEELSAIARFKDGTLLNLRLTHLDVHPDDGLITFTGTKGKYVLNMGDFKRYLPIENGTEMLQGKNREGTQHLYYENIAQVLTGKAELVITPEWSRKPIEILDLATRSARANRAIRVEEV